MTASSLPYLAVTAINNSATTRTNFLAQIVERLQTPNLQCDSGSDNERLHIFHRRQKYCTYARFIKEDDNNFSVMLRVVVGQTLKLLQRSMKKRMMCYFLVRPQQPLRGLF